MRGRRTGRETQHHCGLLWLKINEKISLIIACRVIRCALVASLIGGALVVAL